MPPRKAPVALPPIALRRRITGDADDVFRYDRAMARSGFSFVAGVDEAGRGACAGPLVVGAAVLGSKKNGDLREIPELADSKLLTAAARERVYERIVRSAASWAAVIIEPSEVDRIGLHVANIEGMRRALAQLSAMPDYVLSDGFALKGATAPNLGVWKGDRVAACVAAAGVIAKVTRDRIMIEQHKVYPQYGFDEHKGYTTASHRAALAAHGPSDIHRFCFVTVRRAASGSAADLEALMGEDGDSADAGILVATGEAGT